MCSVAGEQIRWWVRRRDLTEAERLPLVVNLRQFDVLPEREFVIDRSEVAARNVTERDRPVRGVYALHFIVVLQLLLRGLPRRLDIFDDVLLR